MTKYIQIARGFQRIVLAGNVRSIGTLLVRHNHEAAAASSESYQPQTPDHIKAIVDQIAQLKFYEVTLLNDCLRKTLNIPDLSLAAVGQDRQAADAAAQDDDVVQAASVKTSFTVKLQKFDDAKKVTLIKEIKKIIEGMNLVEAKRFVEECPKVIRANVSKDEAEALKKQLEDAGGVVGVE